VPRANNVMDYFIAMCEGTCTPFCNLPACLSVLTLGLVLRHTAVISKWFPFFFSYDLDERKGKEVVNICIEVRHSIVLCLIAFIFLRPNTDDNFVLFCRLSVLAACVVLSMVYFKLDECFNPGYKTVRFFPLRYIFCHNDYSIYVFGFTYNWREIMASPP
jgi:hypothetical protein